MKRLFLSLHIITMPFLSSFALNTNKNSDDKFIDLLNYYGQTINVKKRRNLNLSSYEDWLLLFGDKFLCEKMSINNSLKNYMFYNKIDKLNITIKHYSTSEEIFIKGIDHYIYNEILINYKYLNDTSNDSIFFEINLKTLGDIYNHTRRRKKFLRENVSVEIRYEGFSHDANSEELFQLAKKIDHKICELNGIPYDPNFPEKEDNDSEEDKEVKRKIADGTYTKIEDLPKPQSQSDNVKNNVKNPQEEKTVTKIDSPISPKIENSKSKIFGILGILFTVVFGGFLLIYKKRKKKNKIKNTELNN